MILKTKNITKNFGGIKALDGCSIDIERSKIIALIGPNGSGKTTLFNVISKLIDPDKGQIFFKNKNITKYKDYKVAKSGISRTFQQVRLFENLTIKDHIEIALSKTDEQLFRNLFKKQINQNEKIRSIIKTVGLHKPLKTFASDLSYGQTKLLDLAIALSKPHSLLMLDEPIAGVNPKLKEEIKKMLRKLNSDGETILLIEHDMNFVMDIADYIYVLDRGKIIAKGKPIEIQNNRQVLNAYLGE